MHIHGAQSIIPNDISQHPVGGLAQFSSDRHSCRAMCSSDFSDPLASSLRVLSETYLYCWMDCMTYGVHLDGLPL